MGKLISESPTPEYSGGQAMKAKSRPQNTAVGSGSRPTKSSVKIPTTNDMGGGMRMRGRGTNPLK